MSNIKLEDAQGSLLDENENRFCTTKKRCREEIDRWVLHVIRQVEVVGSEMMEEVEELKLNCMEEQNDLTNTKKDSLQGEHIKFVPNVVFDELKKTDLGFLAFGDLIPLDFHLDLVTLLAHVKVGGNISCSVSCNKVVSPAILGFLSFTVTSDNNPVSIKTGSNPLLFSFPLAMPGQYQVSAQLYGQHVSGSPLTVPVAVRALPGLGLAPLHTKAVPDDAHTAQSPAAQGMKRKRRTHRSGDQRKKRAFKESEAFKTGMSYSEFKRMKKGKK
eukprot:GFUD01024640.1.p1 GENE.GFUD01024640.1~~GFUD01024640.1.p1  ORF type:complete len:288 (+),score=91.09 GFUD01024640.1:51-866(+)